MRSIKLTLRVTLNNGARERVVLDRRRCRALKLLSACLANVQANRTDHHQPFYPLLQDISTAKSVQQRFTQLHIQSTILNKQHPSNHPLHPDESVAASHILNTSPPIAYTYWHIPQCHRLCRASRRKTSPTPLPT